LSIRLLAFLTVLSHLSFAGFRVVLSLMAIHHEASPLTVGVVMSLLTVVAMLFAGWTASACAGRCSPAWRPFSRQW
jgi:hypothetical protein